MRFWRINCPNYENGDYQNSYINGDLEHPFGLPGVNCDVCHQTWGGSRILPYELPPSLRKHANLVERWPISLKQFKALVRHVQDEFLKGGVSVPELGPGD